MTGSGWPLLRPWSSEPRRHPDPRRPHGCDSVRPGRSGGRLAHRRGGVNLAAPERAAPGGAPW